jgi:hypothetical protein
MGWAAADEPNLSYYVYVSGYSLSFSLDRQRGVRIQTHTALIILCILRDIALLSIRITSMPFQRSRWVASMQLSPLPKA